MAEPRAGSLGFSFPARWLIAALIAVGWAVPAWGQQSHFWLQTDGQNSLLGTATNPTVTLRAGESATLYLWLKPAGISYGFDGISFDVRLVGSGTASAGATLTWDLPPGRWTGATSGVIRTDSGGAGIDDANVFDLTNTDTLGAEPLRVASLHITGVTPGTVNLFLCVGQLGIADGGDNAVVWLGFGQNQTSPESLNISGGVPNLCSAVSDATIQVVAPLPDWDLDGDIDQEDFGRFQACLTGPAIVQNDPACVPALLDDDADVDQHDLERFRACFAGPNQQADPTCLNPPGG